MEKKEVMEKFQVNDKQLPKVHASDPVIELLGAKPGNLVKIIRKSETSGEAVYYRLVVKA